MIVVTVVGGEKYLEYSLIYIYSIKKAYPQYDIMIYSWDDFSHLRPKLKLLNAENCMMRLDFQYKKTVRNFQKSRFLLGKQFFKGHKYAYIGDVDFFICKEQPSIEELHTGRVKETGFCYSNKERRGLKRLTGLHFIEVDRYFKLIDVQLQKYKKRVLLGICNITDEEMLFQMCQNSKVGIITGQVRPHHGIHLGYVRQLLRKNSQKGLNNISKISKKYSAQFINAYENDPLFKELIKGLTIENDINILYENLRNK